MLSQECAVFPLVGCQSGAEFADCVRGAGGAADGGGATVVGRRGSRVVSDVIDTERFPRLAARLQLKVPKEKVAQIHEFAKDLAVGYDEGVWGPDALVSAHPRRKG